MLINILVPIQWISVELLTKFCCIVSIFQNIQTEVVNQQPLSFIKAAVTINKIKVKINVFVMNQQFDL